MSSHQTCQLISTYQCVSSDCSSCFFQLCQLRRVRLHSMSFHIHSSRDLSLLASRLLYLFTGWLTQDNRQTLTCHDCCIITNTPKFDRGLTYILCHDSASQFTSHIDCVSTCVSVYMAWHHNICLSSAGQLLSYHDVNLSVNVSQIVCTLPLMVPWTCFGFV